MDTEPKHIVVIGASAGGLNTLSELVSQFDKNWDAAFFVVLHLSRKSISDFLLHRLHQYTNLECLLAKENEPIKRGKIYAAMPNYHLLLKEGKILLGKGPEENRWRPSIDVLFRSAAVAYNSRVTGIILTGMMDDGTTGMWAIKQSGGTSIVQDPNEAEYPSMPMNVLNRMEVDHCVSVAEMGSLLEELFKTKVPKVTDIPQELITEAQIAEKVATGIDIVESIGVKSVYTCPDCGGGLFQVNEEKAAHFRRHIGHSYSVNDLNIKQSENIESTLWIALRMMEERKNLLIKLEGETRSRGFQRFASNHKQKADDLQVHINKLKELLFERQNGDEI